MDLSKVAAGREPPRDLNVIVEIPFGGPPVKYEVDKASGLLFADRFLQTAMFYPGNYGFIPHTLSQDGDPCDVLIAGNIPVISGSVVRCRPIGALLMEDEQGPDEKILSCADQRGSRRVIRDQLIPGPRTGILQAGGAFLPALQRSGRRQVG